MKGLVELPSITNITKAYNNFYSNKKISETNIILYSEWSRFDPRLGEILVEYLKKNWSSLNPILLRDINTSSPWPQALAVILEHVIHLEILQPKLFKFFKALVLEGIEPIKYQAFTIGVFKPGGKEIKSSAINPHPFFEKWGFYEANPFFSKISDVKSTTLLDKDVRKSILKALLSRRKEVTVNDYLGACRHAIHRRQAERDLNNFFKLKKRGQTRNRIYTK
jgi:hypothetical protein